MAVGPTRFVNPLDVDGFAEPGGWCGCTGDANMPILYFLPGMDGSLSTPFMQYPELSTSFELACMTHSGGLDSRASFEELTASCTAEISASARSGRQILLVGESFGATLAIAVAHRLRGVQVSTFRHLIQLGHSDATWYALCVQEVRGLVLVNPATSYERSALARFGPICACLQGPLLYPLYLLSLVGFAALVLTPTYQAPAFVAMLAATKVPALLNNPYREAWLGRVALGAFLGVRAPGLAVGPLLAITPFKPQDLSFRLTEWLQLGASLVNEGRLASQLTLPVMAVVGDMDFLLPSQDEAGRIREAIGDERWRGTVVVQGAGHASTLGNRVDLNQVIREAMAQEFTPALQAVDLVTRAENPGQEGSGWDRGMLDRTFPSLDPTCGRQA